MYNMTKIYHLPIFLTYHIQDYLWGSNSDWKQKNNLIIKLIPSINFMNLNDVKLYRRYSNIIEAEDCLYCPKCGEKNLCFALSFHMDYCLDCNKLIL